MQLVKQNLQQEIDSCVSQLHDLELEYEDAKTDMGLLPEYALIDLGNLIYNLREFKTECEDALQELEDANIRKETGEDNNE